MLNRKTKFDKLKDRVSEDNKQKMHDIVHGGPLSDRHAHTFIRLSNNTKTKQQPRGNYWVHYRNNTWDCLFGDDAMIKNIKAEQDRRNKKL